MQADEDPALDPVAIFGRFNPSPRLYAHLTAALRGRCRRQPEPTREFLASLAAHSPSTINFFAFTKVIRIIKRVVLPLKNKELNELLAGILLKHGHLYFPHGNALQNHRNFQIYQGLFKGLSGPQPASLNKLHPVIAHASKPHSQEWAASLADRISNETLVDKKQRQQVYLRASRWLGPWVSHHLELVKPQLERLLVRSENNIEVWQEFFSGLEKVDLGTQAVPLMQQVKNLFQGYAPVCIKLVQALTKDLSEPGAINDATKFVLGLLSTEHNAKKKIVYVRMLEGPVQSIAALKDLPVRNDLAEQVAVGIVNGLGKFTEADDFSIVAHLLNQVLPLVDKPSDAAAKGLKAHLKSQNKYTLILTYSIMAQLYGSTDHDIPAVNQVRAHANSQVNTAAKKFEANWQWLLPALTFLCARDQSAAGHLPEDTPLFRSGAIGLTGLEKRNALRLLAHYTKHLKSEDEQVPGCWYLAVTVLLEEGRDRSSWDEFINSIDNETRLLLVSRGVYPLSLYPCGDLSKNKGNSFTSLLLFILKSVKDSPVELPTGQDYTRLGATYARLRPSFLKNITTTEDEKVESDAQIARYVRGCVYDPQRVEEQETGVDPKRLPLIDQVATQMLFFNQNYLLDLMHEFTQKQYYAEDLTFLNDFEGQVEAATAKDNEELEEMEDELTGRGLHKAEEYKPKKDYGGVIEAARMMSEQEVKQQKYRLHFERMHSIFEVVVGKIITTVGSCEFLAQLYGRDLRELLRLTAFPQHRIAIMRLLHRSCLFVAARRKSPQSGVISTHAQFIGEFFAFRHAGLTPSVATMHRCEHFLKALLALPIEQAEVELVLLAREWVGPLVNQMCEYLLENMEFDVSLKRLAVRFYRKCSQRELSFDNQKVLFSLLARNINILATAEDTPPLLLHLLARVQPEEYSQLFEEILNYVQSTKIVILEALNRLDKPYQAPFEEFIKLKILALEHNEAISRPASALLDQQSAVSKSILGFNMKNFVRHNSKETIQKLCVFIRDQISKETVEGVFEMVIRASEELFREGFDQEGLEMFPFFLNLNMEWIGESLYKPIFQLLVTQFTVREDYPTLSKLSLDVGIAIIKRNAPHHPNQLLRVLESFIDKSKGVSNIIFLGVLAPYLGGSADLQMIERRITDLFNSDRESEQKAISKCIPDLMSFFKNPQAIAEKTYLAIPTLQAQAQVGQAYLFAGLLKGIGYAHTQEYIKKLTSEAYETKKKEHKLGRIRMLEAMVDNFGRVVEVRGVRIVEIMIGYMADNQEDVRQCARKVGQTLIMKMSAYAVKGLLPELLRGLEEEQNWRVKISYIWILGIMANCSARQLQTSLPIIVPTLSACLSNAHPTIREKASEALNLIGETIKNPEISSSVNILIEALENPFDKSEKAIDILVKTSFNHYIDPPALSLVIPILDYCMRGRSSDLKAGACQVMGSIVELIANPYDLLPYIRFINTGLRVALCDPLSEIRSIASMAIGRISAKIGIRQAEGHFKFVLDIIDSSLSNTTERQGAAQAHAEIICSHSYDYFEESLNRIFEKLAAVSTTEKEGYVLVFLYVPSIRNQEFEGFIREVNESMYGFVSEEEESLRNSAMMVEKVLINNYCLSHTELLLDPLCDGVFENNWKKRNSALILIGEMLNIIKSHMYNTRSQEKAYAYYRGLMAVYIIKDDDLEMPRATANQVWNAYIENTPKTIKTGLGELVRMWTRWTHSANDVVFRNIVAFSSKYAQNYFSEILEHMEHYTTIPEHQVGVFEVLAEFIKRMAAQFLARDHYRDSIRAMFEQHLFTAGEGVRFWVGKCLAIWVDKMHEEHFFEELLYPKLQALESAEESSAEYVAGLHLLRDLLKNNSGKVVERVISRVTAPPMSEFKIEVITNNADRLANHLYSHFKVPPTVVFLGEIEELVGQPQRQNRLSVIVYCLQQVSLHLNGKHKTKFLGMLNDHLRKALRQHTTDPTPRTTALLSTLLDLLHFFLNSTPLSQLDELTPIIALAGPLLFMEEAALRSIGHRITLLLVSDSSDERTAMHMKQVVVCLENKVGKDEVVWGEEENLSKYISVLVKGVAYGREEVMEQSLNMIEFLLAHSTRSLLDKAILRIVGPVIRICNYPLTLKQKIRALELVTSILNSKYPLHAYTPQLHSVCLRLLQEFSLNSDATEAVASTYLALIATAPQPLPIIYALLTRIHTFGTNLIECIHHIMKQVVERGVALPKQSLERVHDDNLRVVLQNEGKLPVKALYHASRTAALLAPVIKKAIQPLPPEATCSYHQLLHHLNCLHQNKQPVPRLPQVDLFLKESNREKLYYLLVSLADAVRTHEESRALYDKPYLYATIPESLTGFEDVGEALEDFEGESPQEQAEINQS